MSKITVVGIAGNSVFLPVEKFHTGGETVEAESVHFEYGGKGFNQAVAAARFGAEVCFVAAVGNESLDGISAFLQKEGIKPCLVRKTEPTAFAAIVTDKSGANRVTVYQGAQLTPEDIEANREEIRDCDILLINNEVCQTVNLAAARLAANNGARIILNPAPYRASDKELLDLVTLFTPNEHEAEGLQAYQNVVQTLGEQGCLIKAEGRTVPACKVRAVDTTGAGDTFNGVLAAALAEGIPTEEAVCYAVKASGNSVTKKGAVSSIPYRKELE